MNNFRRMKEFVSLLGEAAREWRDDNASRCAAAVAYYAAISVAPLLIVVLIVAAAIWGEDAASGQLTTHLTDLMGASPAGLIEEIIANARQPVPGGWAGILSLCVLFWGASNVFFQLQAVLNQIWDAPPPERVRLSHKVYKRATSFAAVILFGVVLLVSLGLSAGLAAVGTHWPWAGSGSGPLPDIISGLLSLVAISGLVGVIFKVLPDVTIRWESVLVGAVLTAGLLWAGKWALGMYFRHATMSSAYGAAGSLVMFLLWVYYSARIFLFGAEFTHVYARHRCR